ncbi:riboflavin synthase [Anaerosinus massiliensis]|uniref:riboflavin synthase n=1 Tax=Massilibacillus massiliensis TaxID=1806837 RepID=UPI000A9847EB|nr:riboflavin synthase [Massilibacillus massiliensis]
MFTGIIEEMGKVKNVIHGIDSAKIRVEAKKVLEDIQLGDSIAVNGTCLTVVEFTTREFVADVMPETLNRTVLAALKSGDFVNLERALTLSSRLGGHIVSGHVDGMGKILAMEQHGNAILIKIEVHETLAKYTIEKGSITIDGISLTVVETANTWFSVSIIPHTASVTTLGIKKSGDSVNIENDVIGKYVERLLGLQKSSATEAKKNKISIDFLKENGF